MFCRNCGVPLSPDSKFCASCGVATAAPVMPAVSAPPKPRKGPNFILGVVAVIAVLAMWGMCTASHNDAASSSSTQQSATVVHKMRESISVGYWSYRCNEARWEKAIVTGYSLEKPDAEFLILDVTIRNDDKTSSTLPPMKLVDSQGREYDESSKAVFLDGSFGMLKSINPGVTSRGYVVFDVPHGQYSLKLSGGFSSGQTALVELP